MTRVLATRRAHPIVIVVLVAACKSGDDGRPQAPDGAVDASHDAAPRVCYFPSGRPCVEDTICLGMQGNECAYVGCDPDLGGLVSSAPTCMRGTIDTTPAGPFDCDPALLRLPAYSPPPAPCPLGALWSIEGGTWGACVAVSNCRPLPCDPAWNGDGCPIDYVCEAASSTCVPAS